MSDHKQHFWEKKYDWDRPTLSSRKLTAWAFAVGERPRGTDEATLRRPHRGLLPDVDFGRAVADPDYRPLWLRVADLLFGSRHPALPADIESELSVTLAAAVGENLAASYIGDDQNGSAAIRKSDDNPDPTRWSRAA